jgi:hypothetical protein
MSFRAVVVVAALAVTGLGTAAFARYDLGSDQLVVAADDSAGKMAPGDLPATDGMKPDDESGAPGSAKMGTDEGTHTGDGQGVKPESDTSKVEQPERRNVPSNDDAVTK